VSPGLGCGGFSRLGLGTGKSEAEAVTLVRQALDLGVNLLDTAAVYGTEPVIGAIKTVPREYRDRDKGMGPASGRPTAGSTLPRSSRASVPPETSRYDQNGYSPVIVPVKLGPSATAARRHHGGSRIRDKIRGIVADLITDGAVLE